MAFGVNYLWRTKDGKILKKLIRDLKNQGDFIEYCVVMIKLIGRRDKPSEYIKLQGILKLNAPYIDKTVFSNFASLTQSASRLELPKKEMTRTTTTI